MRPTYTVTQSVQLVTGLPETQSGARPMEGNPMTTTESEINPVEDSEPIAFAKPEITAEDIAAVTRVLESGWLTTGKEAKALETELAAYLGVDHVITCSSCTTAEEICLAYLALPPGSKVGVPTWTFVSTALAAERLGLEPVLIDVDRDTLNICADALGRAMGELDAVVGVHFGGVPMPASIREMCAAANIPFVEDAAHALGTIDERGKVAGQGTAGACYSFYATKNLSTAEGGAIATDDPALADFAVRYRLHGMSSDAVDRYSKPGAHSYDVTVPGLKANFPDILAALGRSQLDRFEASQVRRRELVTSYRAHLANADVRVVPGAQHPGSADHLFVIDMLTPERRDATIAALTSNRIASSVHFRPLHTFSWFAGREVPHGPGGLPVATELDGRIMSLPLHVNLSLDDIERIASVVLQSA